MRMGHNFWFPFGLSILSVFWGFCAMAVSVAQADQHHLRVVTANEPPANYMENGKLTGLSVGVVREVLKRISPETTIEFLPWARAYSTAKSRPNVMAFTAGRTQERIDLGFHFIGPIITRTHALWKLTDSPYRPSSFEDLRQQNWLVAGLREDWRTNFLIDRQIIVTKNPDIELGLKQLVHGRVQFWITSDLEAPAITRKYGLDLARISQSLIIRQSPSYLMLSKGTAPHWIDRIEASFASLRDNGFFEKEAKAWSFKLGLKLSYQPEKGYFHQPG